MKAVIFDYFGVVSGATYWNSVYAQEEASGRLQRIDELAEEMSSGRMNWQQFCREVAADLNLQVSEVEERYRVQEINAGVVTFARSLRGKYLVCLASNAHHEFLETVLEETALNVVFDKVFISSRLGVTKPHPLFYQKVLEEIGMKGQDCVFVDDIGVNAEAAEEAGMRAVLFQDPEKSLKELKDILTNS